MQLSKFLMLNLFLLMLTAWGCGEDEPRRGVPPKQDTTDTTVIVEKFYFGADLSYVNQILDHGGEYRDEGEIRDPYRIFSDHGTDLVRLRLWHNPVWTVEIYGEEGTQLYNDLHDVAKAIERSKEHDMEVLLDFHYSDTWADPGNQRVPQAWRELTDIGVLADSVYEYTYRVLTHLAERGLMPEMVQIGNETNCGMMRAGGAEGFPDLDVCDDESNWLHLGTVVKSAIRAIREVDADTKIILHVADPVNVDWWFDNLINTAGITDFDIIGISWYPLWHTGVRLHQIGDRISGFISRFQREVMIVETAYPWTLEGNDSYNNLFGLEEPIPGYPFTQEGQLNFLTALTQSLMDAGASGIIYWEPAWITSAMKDQWNTGSSWENNTFFDFEGNTIPGIEYMNYDYETND